MNIFLTAVLSAGLIFSAPVLAHQTETPHEEPAIEAEQVENQSPAEEDGEFETAVNANAPAAGQAADQPNFRSDARVVPLLLLPLAILFYLAYEKLRR